MMRTSILRAAEGKISRYRALQTKKDIPVRGKQLHGKNHLQR